MPLLAPNVKPRLVTVELPDTALVDAVHSELTDRAASDPNQCLGYYPSLDGVAGIDSNLPISRQLHAAMPYIEAEGLRLDFSFVRRSLIQQIGPSPFHLDTDTSTALTGDAETLQTRLVMRLLVNLSSQHSRRLTVIDQDPFDLPLEAKGGYLHCPDSAIEPETIQDVILKPREGGLAEGVLFCSNRVLHTGVDDQFGHFVAGFGTEVAVCS